MTGYPTRTIFQAEPWNKGTRDMSDRMDIGKISMRAMPDETGKEWWVAWFLPSDGDDPIEMGRVALNMVSEEEERQIFFTAMQQLLGFRVRQITGQMPGFRDDKGEG